MAFQKGNKFGHRFTSEDQPAPGKRTGRSSLYQKIKKIVGKDVKVEMTYNDYEKIIRYLMEQPVSVLKQLTKEGDKPREDVPIWVVNVISAILTDVRYGRTVTLDSLLDRVFGKATQSIESEVSVTQELDLSALSNEELLTYNSLIEKMQEAKKQQRQDG